MINKDKLLILWSFRQTKSLKCFNVISVNLIITSTIFTIYLYVFFQWIVAKHNKYYLLKQSKSYLPDSLFQPKRHGQHVPLILVYILLCLCPKT